MQSKVKQGGDSISENTSSLNTILESNKKPEISTNSLGNLPKNSEKKLALILEKGKPPKPKVVSCNYFINFFKSKKLAHHFIKSKEVRARVRKKSAIPLLPKLLNVPRRALKNRMKKKHQFLLATI